MRAYAEIAQAVVANVTEAEFAENQEKQLALTRAIEIIGEAAKAVPEEVRILAPTIPWRQISRTRDKLVHHYFGVEAGIIWSVAKDDLAPLVDALTRLISTLEVGGVAD